VKDLNAVPIDEVKSLLTRFRDEAVAQSFAVAGGFERARELLKKSHGNDAEQILEQIMAATAQVPFQFLRTRRPEQVLSYLSGEHPQVIALVLSHLPLALAARVVEGLDAETRAAVAGRFAKLETADPEIVAEVEQALARRVGLGGSVENTQAKGGVKPLAELLNNVGRETEKGVLAELEAIDPSLAAEVRDLMFVFEDLAAMDDRAMQEILRVVDSRTVAVSLKDASAEMKEKIEKNLSQRAAEDITEIATSLGPVRRSDVDAARLEMVKAARKLEEEGKVMLVRGDNGDFVA
jgi:flagellar motor switch protein FliG